MYAIWNRLQYMLSPQFDIYEKVSEVVRGRVADIGSGTGFGTHLFTRNAQRVHGFEIDELARNFAQRAFGNGKLEFVKSDITKDPGVVRPYDFVVMIDVIEHIEDDVQAVRNCRKLLKPDGKFICSTPNRLSRYRKSEYHVREYSPGELNLLLRQVFETVDILDYQLMPIDSDFQNPIIGFAC